MTSNVQGVRKCTRPAAADMLGTVFIDSINNNKSKGSAENLIDLQWVETELSRRYKIETPVHSLRNMISLLKNTWGDWKQFKRLGSTLEWDDSKWEKVIKEIPSASLFQYGAKVYNDDIEAKWDQIFEDNVYITYGKVRVKTLEADTSDDIGNAHVVPNHGGNGLTKAEEGSRESMISLSIKSKKRSFAEVDTSTEDSATEESASEESAQSCSIKSGTRHENTLDLDASVDCSLETVFHVVRNLRGLEVCSDMSMYAMTLLEDENKRKIIALLPTAEEKLCYIRFLYSNKKGGVNMQTLQKRGPVTCFRKELPLSSYQKGELRMIELLDGHKTQCFDLFRMDQNTFRVLCRVLESKCGLKSTADMSVMEKLGLFVYTLGKGASNKEVGERFEHSSDVVSKVFQEVLRAMDGLSRHVIIPKDREFKEIPSRIARNDKYMPHFKDCIGVIDCDPIPVTVPEEDQCRYRGRRGLPTTNVLASCDFDFQFTFVLAGMEGSAHDARVFRDVICMERMKFPKPPTGKYYLVDQVFPERKGYLTPYLKTRYNQSEFRRANPRGRKEIFNQAHSSLKSCIDKAFGFLKSRWKILQNVPDYSSNEQNKTLGRVIVATFALHNYILRNANYDPIFGKDQSLDFIAPVPGSFGDEGSHIIESGVKARQSGEMSGIRDEITCSLVAAGRQS